MLLVCNKPAVVVPGLYCCDCDVWLIVAHPEFSFLSEKEELQDQEAIPGLHDLNGSNHKYDRFFHCSTSVQTNRVVFGTQSRS